MVFHLGKQNFIAFFYIFAAPRVSNEIYRFSRVAGKNDLSHIPSVYKIRDLFASSLKSSCRFLGEFVNASMDIGIVLFVEIGDSLYNLPGLLASGRIIQINQRFAVNLPL